MLSTLELLKKLIVCPSITPNDAGCQNIILHELLSAGFQAKELSHDSVKNHWIWHGKGEPCLVFVAHTDVVPPGPESKWETPPFTPTEKNGDLYGRGATDMKSGLSAMVIAAIQFVKQYPHHPGTIGFAITSDEEGPAIHGTQIIVDYLKQQKINVNYCFVGEATSEKKLGDCIRVGRRGSLHGDLTIIGKQGHIAYPHLADNPIHHGLLALHELTKTPWDSGNEHFQPTQFQIHTINAGTGANNIIPEIFNVKFNFRFSPENTAAKLQERVKSILNEHKLHYELKWNLSCEPFYSKPGKLAHACQQAIQVITHLHSECNTVGGTSDGRFFAHSECEIIEFGPVNATAHQVNEHIRIDDLEPLTQIYLKTLTHLFPCDL